MQQLSLFEGAAPASTERVHSDDEHHHIVEAVYRQQRYPAPIQFDMPAPLFARILGRSASHQSHYIYTGTLAKEHWGWVQDEVHCGLQRVWKTGALEVYAYCLAHVTEYDLSLCDFVHQAMWAGHCLNRQEQGHPVLLKYCPTFWRNGQRISFGQAMRAYFERHRWQWGMRTTGGPLPPDLQQGVTVVRPAQMVSVRATARAKPE